MVIEIDEINLQSKFELDGTGGLPPKITLHPVLKKEIITPLSGRVLYAGTPLTQSLREEILLEFVAALGIEMMRDKTNDTNTQLV